MSDTRAARGFFEERVRSAIGHHFSHRMGGGESKQDQVVQDPAPTPSEPPAAPAPKAEPTVAPKMSEPTAAPELKEYPEFPGEKLSKRCVYTAVRSCDGARRPGRAWMRGMHRGRPTAYHGGRMDRTVPSMCHEAA